MVVDLALSLRVWVVARWEALAGERSLRRWGVGWVVSSWSSWYGWYLVLVLLSPPNTNKHNQDNIDKYRSPFLPQQDREIHQNWNVVHIEPPCWLKNIRTKYTVYMTQLYGWIVSSDMFQMVCDRYKFFSKKQEATKQWLLGVSSVCYLPVYIYSFNMTLTVRLVYFKTLNLACKLSHASHASHARLIIRMYTWWSATPVPWCVPAARQ